MDPHAARSALDGAASSAERVRSRARWLSTYMGAFAVGFAILTLVIGLVEPPVLRYAGFLGGWAVFTAVMVLWARRQPAHLRGSARRMAPAWGLTAAAYGIAIAVGTPARLGDVAYWSVAAVVVATPLAVGALRERRA